MWHLAASGSLNLCFCLFIISPKQPLMALQTELRRGGEMIDCSLSSSVSGAFCPFPPVILSFCPPSPPSVFCMWTDCMCQCCSELHMGWVNSEAWPLPCQINGSGCSISDPKQNVRAPQSSDPKPCFLLQPEPIRYSLTFSQAQHCQQNQPVAQVTPFSCLLKSISLNTPSSVSYRQTAMQTHCRENIFFRESKKRQRWPPHLALSCKYLLWFSTTSMKRQGRDCIGESLM